MSIKITIDERFIDEIDQSSSPTHTLILLTNGSVIALPKLDGVTVTNEGPERNNDGDAKSL
jgi:hypothetical protein